MRKCILFLVAATLTCATAFGQSSGNFTYGNTGDTHCVLQTGAGNAGQITGGAICAAGSCFSNSDCAALGGNLVCVGANVATNTLGLCQTPCANNNDCPQGQTCNSGVCGNCAGTISAAIKTNSGNGNVFVVRPSAVIGLLTDVSLVKNSSGASIGTSSAYAGVDFTVSANQVGAPVGTVGPCVTPNFDVTYAARFIQISSNLFDMLGTTCTTVTATGAPVGCYFNFAESTVSAHSFDWIVGSTKTGGPDNCTTLSSGTYAVTANWNASVGNTGLAQSLTCVGPVNMTVQQNKIFHFNTVN